MTKNVTNIPQTDFPVGQTISGTVPVSAAAQAVIVLNRTGSGNHNWLNTLTAASGLDLTIQSSPDGVTWTNEVEATMGGGTFLDRNGVTVTTSNLLVQGLSANATEARAVVVVSGPSSITISGSITTQ